MTLYVRGAGLWAPTFAGAKSFVEGASRPPADAPKLGFVPSRMRRATSLMCRAAVEAVVRAANHAGLPVSEVATVFGSAHGEIQIAVEQMHMMHDGDGKISPARFKNSVHNTAAGLFSIAAKNVGFTTAIAAGSETFPMSLLEASMLLKAGEHSSAIVVVSEEHLPEPVDHFGQQQAVAVAFAISTEAAESAAAGPRIGLPQADKNGDTTPAAVEPFATEHPVAPALRLLNVLSAPAPSLATPGAASARRRRIALTDTWSVELDGGTLALRDVP